MQHTQHLPTYLFEVLQPTVDVSVEGRAPPVKRRIERKKGSGRKESSDARRQTQQIE